MLRRAMGVLRRLSDGADVPLAARTLAGRADSCTITLDERYASSEHARIRYTGGGWQIRDLGSRNGTFIGGERLPTGETRRLAEGDQIGFGDPEGTWLVVSVGAPHIVATNLETRDVRSALEMLALPSDAEPRLTVYADEAGRWVVEDEEGQRTELGSSRVVRDRETRWEIRPPAPDDETPMAEVPMTLDHVTLKLLVSRDQEQARIVMVLRGVQTALEPREHAYVLATLAQARLDDADKPEPERGWLKVGALLKMLRYDENTLNVSIHRARQQLSSAGLQGAARVVQVRRGYRRFGTDRFDLGVLE